ELPRGRFRSPPCSRRCVRALRFQHVRVLRFPLSDDRVNPSSVDGRLFSAFYVVVRSVL
ncbi:uncharacterized, partial [Tachysurus ichikawai]